MKKYLGFLVLVLVSVFALVGCGNKEKEIVVGATPSPHAEILNSSEVQDFVKSKGYKLVVKVYQDYATPNKALNDGGLDANYFQHIPYLEEEVKNKGYDICAVCTVHNEPLNLYGKEKVEDFSGLTINIINDVENAERAFKLLVAIGAIDSYDLTDYNPQHPVYTSSKNVTVQCIQEGLLSKKVDEGGYAIIPGNFALTAWGASKASSYKITGETTEVAYPNIIACKTGDVNSEKINILIEALGQKAVQEFIEKTYGSTVASQFSDLRK